MTESWYDRNAVAYAGRTWSLDRFPGLERDLLEFSDHVRRPGPVLDVGAGAGRDSEYLTHLGCQVIGLEVSRSLLDIARLRCRTPLFEPVLASATQLPFAEATIGGVWASGSLLHLVPDDIRKAIGEIRRVLVDGAPFGLSMKCGKGIEIRSDGRLFTYVEKEELRELLSGFKIERLVGPVRRDWLYCLSFAD